jgi:hypothetical protein
MNILLKKRQEVSDIPIREFFERIIDERDRQYDGRFRAGEIAVNAALAAQQKSYSDAFLASEKAIVKAEEAQKAYNVAHNDLSRKMDDQYKTMMPHVEAIGLLKAHEDKMENMRLFFDSKLESQRIAFEKSIDAQEKEIAGLRESRSETTGVKTGGREIIAYCIAGATIVLALILHFIPA